MYKQVAAKRAAAFEDGRQLTQAVIDEHGLTAENWHQAVDLWPTLSGEWAGESIREIAERGGWWPEYRVGYVFGQSSTVTIDEHLEDLCDSWIEGQDQAIDNLFLASRSIDDGGL